MSETKVSKIYFCDKTVNFKVCGETNPENFIEGRYSTCKKCRNKYVREIYKEKKTSKNEEFNKIVDPSSNIRTLIVDTIKNCPIIDGKSIEYKIKSAEDDIGDVLCTSSDSLEKFKMEVYQEIGSLKNIIQTLQEEIRILKKL